MERIGRRRKGTYSQTQGGKWVFVLKTTTRRKGKKMKTTEGKNGKRAVNGLAVNYYVNKAFAFWRAVAE